MCAGNLCRHEDLKIMLDGNKDGQKLDAMKMIMGVGPWRVCFFLSGHVNVMSSADGGEGQRLL